MKDLSSPTSSRIRAVLFDCDGVMCLPMRFAAVLARDHNITTDMTSPFFRHHFTPAILGQQDVANILPPFLSEWGWEYSLDDFITLWLSSEREVRSDMIELVTTVKTRGFITGIATNQELRRAKYMRDEMGFESLFDHCFISSEIGYMKPQDDYFQAATRELGLEPSQIVFIDDQQHYLDGAAAAGWQTILFNGSAQDAETELADLLAR